MVRMDDIVRPETETAAVFSANPSRVLLGAVVAFALAWGLTGTGDAAASECNDMIDNDGDGLVDTYRPSPAPGQDSTLEGADPGCLVGGPPDRRESSARRDHREDQNEDLPK
jgi:hypothetical protein